jgi:hypothetical protein
MRTTRKFTLIPQLETYPRLVLFAQSVPGKLCVLATFALGLFLHGKPWWLELTAILAALTFWPTQRRNWIVAGSLWWTFRHTGFHWSTVHAISRRGGVEAAFDWRLLQFAAIVAALLFCAGFIQLARWKSRLAPMRRPILCLFVAYLGLAEVARSAPMNEVARTVLWAFLIVLSRYLWFIATSVIYPESGRNPLLTVGQYIPFWYGTASTPNPIPKGGGYLQRIEAKDAQELAICQLKGIKLLFWAGILTAGFKLLVDLTNGSGSGPLRTIGLECGFRLPAFSHALADSVAGHALAWHQVWLVFIARFAKELLLLSIWGHILVACCRMSGFKALRNTHRPLESTSIADFWNRYFFYFKEVLVDVFFYPTFLRYFKKHPRVRLFAATLAAATFGNFLFHYLRDIEIVPKVGLWEAMLTKGSYMVYTLLLGVGIGVSQLRQKKRLAEEHWAKRRLLRPAIVMGFYCLLSVFELPGAATIQQRFGFLLSAFDLRLP